MSKTLMKSGDGNRGELGTGAWHRVATRDELKASKVMMVRADGRQIALFETGDGVRACDNRCPHEGFPLSEGSLSDGCLLTCNWHN